LLDGIYVVSWKPSTSASVARIIEKDGDSVFWEDLAKSNVEIIFGAVELRKLASVH
jgi:hypothetical protein